MTIFVANSEIDEFGPYKDFQIFQIINQNF